MKLCLFSIILLSFLNTRASLFFENGVTEWEIYVSSEAEAVERYAGEELQRALKKISAAEFRIVESDRVPERRAIVIGSLKSSKQIKKLASTLQLERNVREQIAVYTLGGNLYLGGNMPRAALYAVYRFLHTQLGVRWFWPGDDGEFMPPNSAYNLPSIAFNETAGFQERSMHACGYFHLLSFAEWQTRNMLNHLTRRSTKELRDFFDKSGSIWKASGHSVTLPRSETEANRELFAKHPEWFSLLNGARSPSGSAGCWSNPEFSELTIKQLAKRAQEDIVQEVCFFPADITLRCQCPKCTMSSEAASRWFDYYRILSDGIKKERPDVKVGTIAYMEYTAVPETNLDYLDNIEYCQRNRCYVHSLTDSSCPLNGKSLNEVEEWLKKVNTVGIWGYHFDIFKPFMYVPFWNMLADEIQTYAKMDGIYRMKTEYFLTKPRPDMERSELNQQKLRLPAYIYAQLVWNPDWDVDALIDDFCSYVYGPAAAEMAEYHRTMASRWESLNMHPSYYWLPPTGTARFFCSPEFAAKIWKIFQRAQDKIKTETNEKTKKRCQAELELEKKLFQDWEKLYALASETLTVNVPQTSIPRDSRKYNMTYKAADGDALLTDDATVALRASEDALVIEFECPAPETNAAPGGDPARCSGWEGISGSPGIIEVFLDPGNGDLYRHFAVSYTGRYYDAKGHDVSWDPEWECDHDIRDGNWIARITIPFRSVHATPEIGDTWKLVVNRYGSRKAGFPSPSYHAPENGATLYFSGLSIPAREIAWINKDDGKVTSFFPLLLRQGWNYTYYKSPQDALEANLSDEKIIVFTAKRMRKADAPLFEKLFTQTLVPAVKKGTLLLIEGYHIPLETYFKDPGFRLTFQEKSLPTPRQLSFLREGFGSTPDDLAKALTPPPPAVYIPQEPDKWMVLGRQKLEDGSEHPFLLARRAGKGMVVVTKHNAGQHRSAENIAPLLNNLLELTIQN